MSVTLQQSGVLKSATKDDTITKEVEFYYQLDSIDEFNYFLYYYVPRKGAFKTELSNNLYFRWYVTSSSVEKILNQAGKKLLFKVAISYRLAGRYVNVVEPQDMPPYNFSLSSSTNEESIAQFYPGTNGTNSDIIYPSTNENSPKPFVNSAGVPIEGTIIKPLITMSFSYNVLSSAWTALNFITDAVGCVNQNEMTICGITFSPRKVRVDSINATAISETYDFSNDGANQTVQTTAGNTINATGTWNYYKIDATFSLNPATFNQNYLNIGTHVRDSNGNLSRIWRYTNPSTQQASFGTFQQAISSGAIDGEAVSDPVFLSEDGTNVSPIDPSTSRQTATYRYGCPYNPYDLSSYGFPTSAPETWSLASYETPGSSN